MRPSARAPWTKCSARHTARSGRGNQILPKYLTEKSNAKQHFEREARAISALQHPHISTLYDAGQQDGVDFLAMEYLKAKRLPTGWRKARFPSSKRSPSSTLCLPTAPLTLVTNSDANLPQH